MIWTTLLLQAVQVDRTLYISGQLGLSLNGCLVDGGVVAEAEKAMENMGHILSAAGGGKYWGYMPGKYNTLYIV